MINIVNYVKDLSNVFKIVVLLLGVEILFKYYECLGILLVDFEIRVYVMKYFI